MTSLKAFTLFFFLWTSRALWAADPPTANGPAAAPGRIVILGDSITAGYGLDPTQAYPAILQRKIDAAELPFTVANAGVSGDTTAGGLRRVDWALGSGAEVLIIALGGNDGLRGVAPQETAQNLAGIIQRARSKVPTIAIIVAGMRMPSNMGRQYVGQFSAVYPALAAEQRVALVPFLLDGVGGSPQFNQPDLIHPNAEGQKRVAENVWKVLRTVLAERRVPRK